MIETLTPALPALLLALALAMAGRRWPMAGGLALGAGVLAGWLWVFGSLPASPRQLPERLPLLALGVLALVGLGLAWRAVPGRLLALLGALAVGWWMAGAPRNAPDLAQAVPVGVVVTGAVLLGLQGGRWARLAAAAALLAGLWWAALPGPALLLFFN
ncbi:hypothetical protein, partial [Falsiroseomonas selenitidurans]